MKNEMDKLAYGIDSALYAGNGEELLKLELNCKSLINDSEESDQPLLNYYLGSLYAGLDDISCQNQNSKTNWKRPYLTKSILTFKKSNIHALFNELSKVRQCQILTNLAMSLNQVGCTIEALEYWNKALSILPNFAMALGGKASGCEYYARTLFDEDQQVIFLLEAFNNVSLALAQDALWESPIALKINQPNFEDLKNKISKLCHASDHQALLEEKKHKYNSNGNSKQEKKYRKWRAENQLFLNPLNDILTDALVCSDILSLPPHTYKVSEKPRFVEYFDLLKQEYIYACYLLFDGIDNIDQHYADIDVLLFEHGDYGISGIRSQNLKNAFKSVYSILDKIAVFINDYFKLGHNPKKIYFRTVWYEKLPNGQFVKDDDGNNILNPKLPFDNFRLRAIYSLSLEIYNKDFLEISAPEASKIDEIRNFIEHKFLSIHDTKHISKLISNFDDNQLLDDVVKSNEKKSNKKISKKEIEKLLKHRHQDIYNSTELHYKIELNEFNAKTIRLLKIARSALIYLSMVVSKEEKYSQNKNVPSISISGIQKTSTIRKS